MDPDMRLGIQMTHSEGCYRWHHECAIRQVDELRAEVERLGLDLEICIEERNVVHDALMTKSNNLSTLRARVAVLEGAVEWALETMTTTPHLQDELRRRAKEGKRCGRRKMK